jgi:hypothetical protein
MPLLMAMATAMAAPTMAPEVLQDSPIRAERWLAAQAAQPRSTVGPACMMALGLVVAVAGVDFLRSAT